MLSNQYVKKMTHFHCCKQGRQITTIQQSVIKKIEMANVGIYQNLSHTHMCIA